ncbi:hypothetical protein GCM10022254_39170 [Actinomadura meridiana]|uniref:Lipoprotein n=1 Tax=Actinomadura meridiana TaxID=559626 RepID=A0ABP8C6F3_9ACTN
MRKITFAALLLVGLAGCSSGSENTAKSAPTPTGGLGSQPGIGVKLSPEDDKTIILATELAVRSCMAKAGFKYFLFGTSDNKPEAGETVPFGQTIEQARVNGYGGDPRKGAHPETGRPQEDANTRYVATLSTTEATRYNIARDGKPNDEIVIQFPGGGRERYPRSGCQTVALHKLYGSPERYAQHQVFAATVVQGTEKAIDADPRVMKTQKAWADCVRKAGYSYPNQTAMMNAALNPYHHATGDLTKIRQREIQIAVAAATCDRDTNTTETYDRVTQELYDKRLGSRQGELAAYIQIQKDVVTNAKKTIQNGG